MLDRFTATAASRPRSIHFRWDWGPELLCMGPDRPINFRIFSSRFGEVVTNAQVDHDLQTSFSAEVEIEGPSDGWRVSLLSSDGNMIRQETMTTARRVDWEVATDLWWPIGQGSQTRYTVEIDLIGVDGSIVDRLVRKVGFRRVELVQDPLEGQAGTSFYFKINNRPIYIAGSNWIPIDMILPTGTEDRYRKWLKLLARGGQNMIRVWGGGVFEPDCFYDICDEMGILVWQDFMFACGVYPTFPEFVESVTQEADCNVKRLRHHPSMVLFCGNNEDYQQVHQWNLSEDGDPLPARLFYEDILPKTVARLCDIPYWFGSPYGGKGWDTADETVGDVHQWDVWGKLRHHQDWDIMGGRFVSEFGMPSLPDMRTVDYWHGDDMAQRFPQSRMMMQHTKAGSYERRFAFNLNENFRIVADLESYIYMTQLLQREAVESAYTTWRREWRGPGKEYNGGTIVWQLNDCWPGTSWAIVDYFLRPKPAYFAIKRAVAPVALGMRREVTKNRVSERPRQFYEYGAFQSRDVTVQIWSSRGHAEEPLVGELQVTAFDISTHWTETLAPLAITLLPNQSTELLNVPIPQPPIVEASDSTAPSGSIVVHAVIKVRGQVVARYTDWPQPYKLLELPNPGLTIKQLDNDVLGISVLRPIKGLWLDVEGDDTGVAFSDNSLDICPGDEQSVRVTQRHGRPLKISWLGQEMPRPIHAMVSNAG